MKRWTGNPVEAHKAMVQYSLLPQRIRRVDPTRTADALGVGVAESGQRYIVKATLPWHEQLPASEWICHGLAQCMHLAVPHWERCVLPDGREAIGSRIEGQVLEREFYPSERPDTDNPDVLSRTYILDLFVANCDRHQGQWLVTEAGGGSLLRPIDFSRAWFKRWPLPTPPFGPGAIMGDEKDQSDYFYRVARRHDVLRTSEAREALDALTSLPKATWRRIVESVPAGWLGAQQVIDLSNWWLSPQWKTRITWIRSQL